MSNDAFFSFGSSFANPYGKYLGYSMTAFNTLSLMENIRLNETTVKHVRIDTPEN